MLVQLTGRRKYGSARYQARPTPVTKSSSNTDKVTATLTPDILIEDYTADDRCIYTIGGRRRQGVVGAPLLLGIDQGDGNGDNGDDCNGSSYVLLGEGDHCWMMSDSSWIVR